ncbi:MAG: glycosyltransferase [Solirubrobacterales bacterium]|nr:glycosyltransferase [Solirubrobacterales bacterium]
MRVTVVVPSHARPVRLRWCLDALARQTVPAEVIVVCDDPEPPEVGEGVRLIRLPPGTGTAPVQRNAGWRAASGALVAFTDDDCRPEPAWLEHLLAAYEDGAVVQGRTIPDPDEAHLLARSPRARTLAVDPPGAWGQTANILYPKDLLERLGGFDERFHSAGEDADLLQRALGRGARQVAARDAVVRHAVETPTLAEQLQSLKRWEAVPALVRRHPQLRDGMPLRVFWKHHHATLALALRGAAAKRPALALPWLAQAAPRYGWDARGRARSVAELPAQALLDATEMAIVARGAVKARTPLL